MAQSEQAFAMGVAFQGRPSQFELDGCVLMFVLGEAQAQEMRLH